MSNDREAKGKLKPLQISCTSTDCENGLHCFKMSKKMAEHDKGKCRSCGENLIEWDRIHQRELSDATYVFESLKKELIRHHYWHKPIDLKAQNHAKRKGRLGLKNAVRKRLEKSVVLTKTPYDGRQTPFEGNIIYYAQHALACCCRTCMEYWHQIPKNVELTEKQLDYFTELAMLYIVDRMPELTEGGERVPYIRKR